MSEVLQKWAVKLLRGMLEVKLDETWVDASISECQIKLINPGNARSVKYKPYICQPRSLELTQEEKQKLEIQIKNAKLTEKGTGG